MSASQVRVGHPTRRADLEGQFQKQIQVDVNEPEVVATCPMCAGGAFYSVQLPTTVLLVCGEGCTGRRIAVGLALDRWPEVRR